MKPFCLYGIDFECGLSVGPYLIVIIMALAEYPDEHHEEGAGDKAECIDHLAQSTAK